MRIPFVVIPRTVDANQLLQSTSFFIPTLGGGDSYGHEPP